MKAKPLKIVNGVYELCDISEVTHIRLKFPGPIPNRIIPVITSGKREGTRNWTWNGDTDKPTLKPSILSKGGDENGEHICHSFVNDGKVIFLDDCSHELKGQTLDLLDVDF